MFSIRILQFVDGLFMKNTTLCDKILHFVVKHFFCGTISHFCGTLFYFFDTLWYICCTMWYICGTLRYICCIFVVHFAMGNAPL